MIDRAIIGCRPKVQAKINAAASAIQHLLSVSRQQGEIQTETRAN